MTSGVKNLEDLELIQLVSIGDAVSLQTLQSQNFRLTTFFSGWVASEAIEEGRVDMIPSRFVKIPQLIESRLAPIDVAIVQITPPNEAGFCSLGIAIDVAREALEQASIRVGERCGPGSPRAGLHPCGGNQHPNSPNLWRHLCSDI
jgi:acyl-CoA hydrolase